MVGIEKDKELNSFGLKPGEQPFKIKGQVKDMIQIKTRSAVPLTTD